MSADRIKNINVKDFYNELASNYPESPQLFQYSLKCNQPIENDNENMTKAFTAYDFNAKSVSLHRALSDLLTSKAQIRSMIGDQNPLKCDQLSMGGIKKYCGELNACPASNQNKLLEQKIDSLNQVLTSLRPINADYNENIKKAIAEVKALRDERELCARNFACSRDIDKMRSFTDKLGEGIKKVNALKEARTQMLNEFLKINPLFAGEKLKTLFAQAVPEFNQGEAELPSPKDFSSAVVAQLNISQKNIDKKIGEYNDASKCLIGKSQSCENFEERLKEIKYKPESENFLKAPNLSNMASYYSCLQTVQNSRNEADAVLDDVLISAALTLTPLGVETVLVKGAGALTKVLAAQKALQLTSMASKIEKAANMATTGFVIGYEGVKGKEIYDQCQEAKQDFDNLGMTSKTMKCEDIDQVLINKNNTANCSSQALLSAAMLSPIAAPAVFKLYKLKSSSKVKAKADTKIESVTPVELASENATKIFRSLSERFPKLKTSLDQLRSQLPRESKIEHPKDLPFFRTPAAQRQAMADSDAMKIAAQNLPPDLEKTITTVYNSLNDEKVLKTYFENLFMETAELMAKRGTPSDLKLLAEGRINEELMTEAIRAHFKGRGMDKIQSLKESDPKSFMNAVRSGPFIDSFVTFKSKIGNHGQLSHLIQRDIINDVISKTMGNNPQKFWDFLGSEKGINFWVDLFDSKNPLSITCPETLNAFILKTFVGTSGK